MPYNIEKYNVIIADNNFLTRKMTKTILSIAGIKRIFEAENIETTLQSIDHHRPDCVIAEWHFKDGNVLDLLKAIRNPALFSMPHIPVMIATSKITRHQTLKALRSGVHDILIKPLSPKAITEHLALIFLAPREFIHQSGYFGPKPRPNSMLAKLLPETRHILDPQWGADRLDNRPIFSIEEAFNTRLVSLD